MKKGNVLKKILLALALVAAVIAVHKGIEAYRSPVAKLAAFFKAEATKVQGLVEGCIQRGLKDPNVAVAILISGGQVCAQAMQGLIEREGTDKAICSANDGDCYFILGYSATSLMMGFSVESMEQVRQLQAEAEEALRIKKEER
jgi:hypothetical protein